MTTTKPDVTQAARVAAQIGLRQYDPFLKALFDLIVARKDVLGDALPPQQRITPEDIAKATSDIVDEDMKEAFAGYEQELLQQEAEQQLADWERELLQQGAQQPPALHTPPKPKSVRPRQPRHYKRVSSKPAILKRPDAGMAAQPENSIQPYVHYSGTANPDDYLLLGRNLYARSDVIGICVQVGSLFGLQDLRVQVVGVGPKAVKALIVNQPPVGTMHGSGTRKVDLREAWATVTPVYFQHSILSPVLAHY